MAKGTARAATNIKPMAGGGAIATLPAGGWVYGDVGTTDIMNFTHWYRPTGQKMELGALCKATKSNLDIDIDAVEPGEEPPVDPPTDPIDLSQFDRIVMKRIGHLVNGVIEYGQFSYTGEKDLDV